MGFDISGLNPAVKVVVAMGVGFEMSVVVTASMAFILSTSQRQRERIFKHASLLTMIITRLTFLVVFLSLTVNN